MGHRLGYGIFDADNHYYEATDALTRHLDPKLRRRVAEWAEVRGKPRLLIGGALNDFIPNPTFDPIGKPGALMEYYLGTAEGGRSFATRIRDVEPLANRPEYRDRAARLVRMDEQGMDGCWLFPTLGVGIEHALRDDLPACQAAFSAFNRWLDEDWGFAHRDRLFATPYLCLRDVDLAVQELEWVLARGARVILIKPGPVETATGRRSGFGSAFDPFWSRVAEAGLTTAIHGGASAYSEMAKIWGATDDMRAFFGTPLASLIHGTHRDIHDTLAAMICDRLFARHPRLRVASIENGASWLAGLLQKLAITGHQYPDWFPEAPVETFRRHVWVAPFWEDDPVETARLIGADRTLLGSDWPHLEGVSDPARYADRLGPLGADGIRRVMRENAAELTRPPAA
ncbi:MAG: amidohydrolase family protein [Myxococcota bacterium]